MSIMKGKNMKNKNTENKKKNPYRTFSFEYVKAPFPDKSGVSGKSIKTNGDLRVKGGK